MQLDWTNIITCLLGAILGTGGSVLYYKPKRKEADTNADKAHYDYVEDRLNSMEKLYKEQGEILDGVRRKMLDMGEQMLKKDEKIVSLEAENQRLAAKVEKMEQELEAYKVLVKK